MDYVIAFSEFFTTLVKGFGIVGAVIFVAVGLHALTRDWFLGN